MTALIISFPFPHQTEAPFGGSLAETRSGLLHLTAIWSTVLSSLHRLPTSLVSVPGPQVLIPGLQKQLQIAWVYRAGGKSLICARAEGTLS